MRRCAAAVLAALSCGAAVVAALACAAAATAAPARAAGFVAAANRICAQEHGRFARLGRSYPDTARGYVRFATDFRPVLTRLARRLGALHPPRGRAALHRSFVSQVRALGEDLAGIIAAGRGHAPATRVSALLDRFMAHAHAADVVVAALGATACVIT